MMRFRPHRALLADAMAECVDVESGDLINYLQRLRGVIGFTDGPQEPHTPSNNAQTRIKFVC